MRVGDSEYGELTSCDIKLCHTIYTFLCYLHFTPECAVLLVSSPGLCGGSARPAGTSVAIAESICDASERVADLSEAIYTSGGYSVEENPTRFLTTQDRFFRSKF